MLKVNINNTVGSIVSPLRVNSVHDNYFTAIDVYGNEYNSLTSEIKPIELTPSILFRYGFLGQFNENGNQIWKHKFITTFVIRQLFNGLGYFQALRLGNYRCGYLIKPKIIYLHELQQLCIVCCEFDLQLK